MFSLKGGSVTIGGDHFGIIISPNIAWLVWQGCSYKGDFTFFCKETLIFGALTFHANKVGYSSKSNQMYNQTEFDQGHTNYFVTSNQKKAWIFSTF